MRSRITEKLALNIILFSSAITLLLTALQLNNDYNNDLKIVHGTIRDIEAGIIGTLSRNLWVDDDEEVHLAVIGINALPGITYAAIKIKGKTYSESGAQKQHNSIINVIPINYQYRDKVHQIGELYIHSDLDAIYDRLFNRFWIILASNAFKTLIVSLFMFFLIKKLVVQRLQHIASFIRNNSKDFTARIEYIDSIPREQFDEIDTISDEINQQQATLDHYVGILKFSEEKIRMLLNSSGDGICGIDTEYRISFINPAGVWLLGYNSSSDMIGMKTVDISDKNINSSLLPMGSICSGVFRKKDSSTIPVEYTMNPLFNNDVIAGYVLTFKDITNQKNTETDLIVAKDQAEAANRAKSLFLSNMSHELRTPLNAIMGFTQLLAMDNMLSDSQQDAIREIMSGGKHLLILIDEILDMAKIEAGKLQFSPQNTPVSTLIIECLSLAQPLSAKYSINLLNHLNIPSDLTLYIDTNRFKQVIINLLSNAIKYNRENGTVTLLSNIDYGRGYIRLTISDTGTGLTEEQISRLFRPFERLGEYEGIDGTGIGLTISKNLVEAMNGTIGLSSTPGEGTNFWVEFPFSIPGQKRDDQLISGSSQG